MPIWTLSFLIPIALCQFVVASVFGHGNLKNYALSTRQPFKYFSERINVREARKVDNGFGINAPKWQKSKGDIEMDTLNIPKHPVKAKQNVNE